MKAAVLPDKEAPFQIQEVPIPAIGQNQVLIRVKAVSLNKRDWWIQKGQYAGLKYPIILGSDGSGIIEKVGELVDSSLIGKEVVLYPATGWGNNENFQGPDFTILGLPNNGCMAEYVSVDADTVFDKPGYMSFEQAAALPVAGLTAFRALFKKGAWQPGEKVLISGVGGGAGSFALQWAVASGAEVWVSSGSDTKIENAIRLGAKSGVNYHQPDWAEQLKQKAGEFDVIIDSALGEGFTELVNLAARGARIVFFGGTSGNLPSLNGRPLFWKQISILGTTLGTQKDFGEMLAFCNQHKIEPIIDQVYTLEEAQKAIMTMDKGSDKFGKIILKIDC